MGVWVPDSVVDFTSLGDVARGAPIGGLAQYETGTGAYLKNVAGVGVKVDAPDNPPCYLLRSSPGGQRRLVLDTGAVSGVAQSNTCFEIVLRTPSSASPHSAGGIFLDYGGQLDHSYTAQWRLNDHVNILLGSVSNIIATDPSGGTGTTGHKYRLQADILDGAAGHSVITLSLWDRADLDTLIGQVTLDDADATMNGAGPFMEGLACEGFWTADHTNLGANWILESLTAYSYMAQVPAGTIGSATLNASGASLDLGITGDGGPWVLASGTSPTGLTVQGRLNSRADWQTFALTSSKLATPNIRVCLQKRIPKGWQVRVIVAGSNVVDTLSDVPVAIADGTTAATNGSAYVVKRVPGLRDPQFLGTRGLGEIVPSLTYFGSQVQTSYRTELPFGASGKDGWDVGYLGFNDGTTTDDIVIIRAAYAIAPDTASKWFPTGYLTFNGGNPGVTIAHDTLVYSDPITHEIPPGCVVFIRQWYKTGDPATHYPVTTWFLDVKETATGAEDYDGVIVDAVTDHTLIGGFLHDGNPFPGVFPLVEGYAPAHVRGIPADDYQGATSAVLYIADSLANNFDLGADNLPTSGRGVIGRALGTTVPHVVYNKPGTGHSEFMRQVGSDWLTKILVDPGSGKPLFQTVMNAIGVNDVRLAANPLIDTYLRGLRMLLAQVFAPYPSIKVMQAPLSPVEQLIGFVYGAPTDSGGPNDIWYGTFRAERNSFNAWVLSDPVTDIPNLATPGHWNWNTVWELGNCQWVVIYRHDGLHYNTAGAVAGAPTIAPIPTLAYPSIEVVVEGVAGRAVLLDGGGR